MDPADILSDDKSSDISAYPCDAGCRYWTASLLPALAGTTLPFWLRPSPFSFKWVLGIEFLIATVLFHAGFAFLLAWRQSKSSPPRSEIRLLTYACACLVLACLLGLHINNHLILRSGVPKTIFIVYGLTALFVGVLYVSPPFNFYRRAGGEIIIAEGLGMIPLLGAYLVQAGDLTRTVYLASLPLVVATGLWVWMDKLASQTDDEKNGRRTLVIEFGPCFSGRYGVPALSVLLIATLLLAVFSGSVNPVTLIALSVTGRLGKIVRISWNEYSSPKRMAGMRKLAFVLHLAVGIILAGSSLVTLLIGNG